MIVKIRHGLYLGDADDASRKPNEIDYTITVAKNSPFIGAVWFSLEDDAVVKNEALFKAAISSTISLIENGHSVLIHCVAGLSRSPAVCAGVLMGMDGLSLEEAINRIRELKPSIHIHPYFINRLREIEEETVGIKNEFRG